MRHHTRGNAFTNRSGWHRLALTTVGFICVADSLAMVQAEDGSQRVRSSDAIRQNSSMGQPAAMNPQPVPLKTRTRAMRRPAPGQESALNPQPLPPTSVTTPNSSAR